MMFTLNDLSAFLNDSEKYFKDASKKDQEFRDDVTKRLSDLEFKYARLCELVDMFLNTLPKGD